MNASVIIQQFQEIKNMKQRKVTWMLIIMGAYFQVLDTLSLETKVWDKIHQEIE